MNDMADIEQFRKDALEIINAVIREHNSNCVSGDQREYLQLQDIQIRLTGPCKGIVERCTKRTKCTEPICYREITFREEDDRCILSRPDDQVRWEDSVLMELLSDGKITKHQYESATLSN